MDKNDIPIIGGTAGKPQRKALDALFGLADPPTLPPSSEGVHKVPVAELHTFPNHPFTVREDADMDALIESIRENGVLMPLLVRVDPKGGYQLISGHRRTHAARAVGLAEVPAIVEDLTDEEATIQMVDSNLHRERILPSEKARAYKMRMDALKRQGKRTDLSSSPMATKIDTAAALGAKSGESRDQVFRYIRLNHLIPPLLDMVDAGDLPLRAAVELSYCNKGWQEYELDMYQHDTKATIERAQTARSLSEDDPDGKRLQFMSTVVAEEREKKEKERREKAEAEQRGELRKPRRVTLSEDDLSPFFSELITAKQIKVDLLHMLATGQTADSDQWYENGASHANLAIVVARDPDDPYEISCPMCGADLHGGPRTYYARQGHTDTNPINFCWVCGQRLDWGEADTE